MSAAARRPVRAWVAGALAALLGACVGPPVRVRSADLATRGDALAADVPSLPPAPDAPRVWIGRVADERADRSSLGAVGGRPFSSDELTRWLDGELGTFRSSAFAVVRGEVPDATAAVLLRPRILKAYVASVAITKTAVLVLGVDVAFRDGGEVRRVYRGQHASLNWASGEREVIEGIQEATASCLAQLRADVEQELTRLAPTIRPQPLAGRRPP